MSHTPQQMMKDLVEAFAAHDLDALMDLYEPDAAFAGAPGVLACGIDDVRAASQKFIDLGGQMVMLDTPAIESGSYALHCGLWQLEGTDADGEPVTLANGDSHATLHRSEADGRWRFVIDNPFGSSFAEASAGDRRPDSGSGSAGAHAPEQLFEERLTALKEHDLDALMDLYEPDAVFAPAPGVLARGADDIRAALQKFVEQGGQMVVDRPAILESGSFAMISDPWRVEGTDPDGHPVTLVHGDSVCTVRRSDSDGRWRFVIDNPWGTAFTQTPDGNGGGEEHRQHRGAASAAI